MVASLECVSEKVPDQQKDRSTWFVAKLKPHSQSNAEASAQGLGCRTLVPQVQATWRTRFGWREGLRPLFPGYMFVGTSSGSSLPNGLRYARGIAGVLSDGSGHAGAVQERIMDDLLDRFDGKGVLRATHDFKTGDEISIVNGPFTGWVGKVLSASEGDRLRLLVGLFGGEVRLQTSRSDVARR